MTCTIAASPAGDTWLSNEVPKILESQAYRDGGALFITWDESESPSGDVPIGMLLLSPFAKKNYSNSISCTHSSTLKTVEEVFGVTPLLRDAANATDLSDLFVGLPGASGVVNSASFVPGFEPGSWVTIFGSNLALNARGWRADEIAGGKLPTSLDGVSVTINGLPAFISYISPTQLSVQAPSDSSIIDGQNVSVTVTSPVGTARATGTHHQSDQLDGWGEACYVSFAGLVIPGVYQVNAVVPDVPDGDNQVSLHIGNVLSQNTALLAVQH